MENQGKSTGNCCCGSSGGQRQNCCGAAPSPHIQTPHSEIPCPEPRKNGYINTSTGYIPRVTALLTFADRFGAWKTRWGIGRMNYRVDPGLYAAGDPTPESPVLVTANYKLTFDTLRSRLSGRNLWILVLDTNGINVWCAAGKGTFGTGELINRIASVRLSDVVSHRTLVLPQLGAPGINARQVRRDSGFTVVFGPVRADDVPLFLDSGLKATPEMRRVRFTLRDRIVLIPLELVTAAKYSFLISLLFMVMTGVGRGGYSYGRAVTTGISNGLLFLLGSLSGAILIPILLPWLPGRAFSLKGVWVGLVCTVLYQAIFPGAGSNVLSGLSWFFMLPAVTSFLAMNFTGASTYTSLSGVKREIRFAVPVQAAAAVTGLLLWLSGRFI